MTFSPQLDIVDTNLVEKACAKCESWPSSISDGDLSMLNSRNGGNAPNVTTAQRETFQRDTNCK